MADDPGGSAWYSAFLDPTGPALPASPGDPEDSASSASDQTFGPALARSYAGGS